MSEKRFADLGRVEAIRLLLENSPFKDSRTEHFNTESDSHFVSAHKIYLEGINFDLTYFPLKHLGYKCIIGATGELYAAMAHPKSFSVRFGVSSKLDFTQIKEIWEGMCTAAKEHGYELSDLDLAPSTNGLFISVSSTGICSTKQNANKNNLSQNKAESKDLICLSGSIGASFLGMSILEKGKPIYLGNAGKDADKAAEKHKDMMERYKFLVGSYLRPELSAQTVFNLEKEGITPSFGYFVNRGLADSLMQLSKDSGLGVKVYMDKIPFEGNSFAAGKELDIDPVTAAMNGGEDCRLLFVIPISEFEKFRKDFQTFDIIGHLAQKNVGTVIVTPEGAELPVSAPDWKNNNFDVE